MKWINIFRNKLAVKLSVLVLCISLFLLLAFVFTNQYAAKKVRQNTLELNRKLLAQVENQLEDFLTIFTMWLPPSPTPPLPASISLKIQ